MSANLSSLASLYRLSQLYAHMAHNLTGGETFFQDHSFFGDLYGTYEDAYDGIIERMIGIGQTPDIVGITKKACEFLADHSSDKTAEVFYSKLSATEIQIRGLIDNVLKGQSQGTTNFLQGLADESEVRSFKISQRLK